MEFTYHLADGYQIIIPSAYDRPHLSPNGFMPFFKDQFYVDIRFLVHPFFFLKYVDIFIFPCIS